MFSIRTLQLTAAGERLIWLWTQEWTTDETIALKDAGSSFSLRGFHGDYEVKVTYQGQEVQGQTFTLEKKSSASVSLNVV